MTPQEHLDRIIELSKDCNTKDEAIILIRDYVDLEAQGELVTTLRWYISKAIPVNLPDHGSLFKSMAHFFNLNSSLFIQFRELSSGKTLLESCLEEYISEEVILNKKLEKLLK